MILIWNLVSVTHFIEYQYFTLGGPFTGSPTSKNRFYVFCFYVFLCSIIIVNVTAGYGRYAMKWSIFVYRNKQQKHRFSLKINQQKRIIHHGFITSVFYYSRISSRKYQKPNQNRLTMNYHHRPLRHKIVIKDENYFSLASI